MGSSTIGFAVSETDRKRLDRLVRRYGHGNRSAFLRFALDQVERMETAQALRAIQRHGVQKSAERGLIDADMVKLVKDTLREPPPERSMSLDDIRDIALQIYNE